MTNSTGFTAFFSTTRVTRVLLTLATRRHFGKALVVGIVYFLAITSSAWAAGETQGSDTSDKKDKYSAHDYTVLVRPMAWLVFVEGKYKADGPRGQSQSLKFDGDLGYDDPYPTFTGEARFRWGRHDFSIIGTLFDESEDAPINASFTIGGKDFDVGGVADTKTNLTDINFRYGYSFFEFEEDGFRLGPTIAVSYTELSVELRELTIAGIPTGTQTSWDETLPIPTIGFSAEVPFGNFLFSTQIGVFYFDSGNFEGLGLRAIAGAVWRPYDHVGFFAGLKTIYVDLELKSEEVDDLTLWGPAVGLEFRF
jgi:hypothetical protein